MDDLKAVRDLYAHLMASWNARDAAGFAALFTRDGHIVGFDGSMVDGSQAIADHLAQVFGSHETATYVYKVRDVQQVVSGAALLRAVVGMVPPGGTDLNPSVNAVQSLLATAHQSGEWRAVLLHTTPAAFHGRPEAVEALTSELREVLEQSGGAKSP
jgi:uncharacterized protein (TIGR02246 family)